VREYQRQLIRVRAVNMQFGVSGIDITFKEFHGSPFIDVQD
jgi:hypothetical protein